MSPVREILIPTRDRTIAATKRGARRLTRTRAGRVATANLKRLADRLHPAEESPGLSPDATARAHLTEIAPVADGTLTVEDAVELGHRLILARPPDPQQRDALIREIKDGRLTVGQALGGFAASDEFAGRVAHQRAIVRATDPGPLDGLVDARELAIGKSVEEHNSAAEGYFASTDEAAVESMLAKPFAQPAETTELLTCFAHMIDGLRLLPGDRLLDFAAGTGWTSWMFTQLGAEVICSDVSPSALVMARRRYERWPSLPGRPHPSFLVFDGRLLGLPDASVDKICCFDAFHHVVNQAEVMAEFARVLRPGGLIGFDEPGHHHSKMPQSQYEMRTFGVVEGDIDLGSMAAMARDAGLEFVAADMLTVRPIWSDLDSFTDLVRTRVPNATMIQQFAHQIHNKQQFILAKPGGRGPDSRDRSALRAELTLTRCEVRRDGDGYQVEIGVLTRNTGAARWLGPGAPIGAVAMRARASDTPGWELDLTLDGKLDLGPGEERELTAVARVPGSMAGQDLAVNLVAEAIAWFDVCGTEPVIVPLPA